MVFFLFDTHISYAPSDGLSIKYVPTFTPKITHMLAKASIRRAYVGIGLRENLQETMVFSINLGGVPVHFPLDQSTLW